MKIFGFPVSPFVRKIIVIAAEKGIETEIVPSNPMQPDEAFLAVSPYRKIPAIEDAGFTLADSSAIAHYMEAKYPNPALLPADPQARAMAVWFDEVADTILMGAASPMIFNRFVRPKIFGQEGDEAAASAAEEALVGRLGYLEDQVGDGWLNGNYSIGDIAVASCFKTFSYADWSLDPATYPKLAAWYDRVCQRPAWQAVAERERAISA